MVAFFKVVTFIHEYSHFVFDAQCDIGSFQAMGRVGETVSRTWQTAHKMKEQFGPLPEDDGANNDNFRVKRYIAKYTINPARAHGIAGRMVFQIQRTIALLSLIISNGRFFFIEATLFDTQAKKREEFLNRVGLREDLMRCFFVLLIDRLRWQRRSRQIRRSDSVASSLLWN